MTTHGGTVPFIPEPRIERAAGEVLARWATDRAWSPAPPVPVDEIVELQMELRVDYDDLRARLGIDDVLGAIWFGKRLIRVDESLNIESRPHLLGRYRWTLAHEGGHWILHREILAAPTIDESLFGDLGAPAFVCRSGQKPPEEKQADLFARHLLMPTDLVRGAWRDWRGDAEPVFISDLRAEAHPNDSDDFLVDRFIRPFADLFEVSREAMRYRLQGLGLVLPSRDGLLFT